jgi:hypothetical protein
MCTESEMMNRLLRPAAKSWGEITQAKIWLLGITALLQAADVLTTDALIGVPGAVESNRLMAVAIASFGPLWWVPKILVLPSVFYVLGRYKKIWPAVAVVVLYSCILANNIFVMAMTRGF